MKTQEQSAAIAQKWVEQAACPRCGNTNWSATWQAGSKYVPRGWKLICGKCKNQSKLPPKVE